MTQLLTYFFMLVIHKNPRPDGGREGGRGSNALTDTLAAHISCGTYPYF